MIAEAELHEPCSNTETACFHETSQGIGPDILCGDGSMHG